MGGAYLAGASNRPLAVPVVGRKPHPASGRAALQGIGPLSICTAFARDHAGGSAALFAPFAGHLAELAGCVNRTAARLLTLGNRVEVQRDGDGDLAGLD